MKKSDLLKLLESLTDEQDVNEILKDTDIVSSGLTLDKFKSKVKEDKDFKSYIDSLNDSHHAKALKTMKEKGTWEVEFSDVLKNKFPEMVTDPKDKQLIDMQKKLEDMEKKEARAELLKEAIAYAGEKNLPSKLVDKFLGDDLDSTKSNLDLFADNWSKAITSAVESKLASSSYTPPGGGGSNVSIGSSFAKQRNEKSTEVNDPWSK